jgi:hypothetical protein
MESLRMKEVRGSAEPTFKTCSDLKWLRAEDGSVRRSLSSNSLLSLEVVVSTHTSQNDG